MGQDVQPTKANPAGSPEREDWLPAGEGAAFVAEGA